MLLDAFSSVVDFIVESGNYINFGLLAIISLSLLLVTIIVSFLFTQFSLELKTARAVERLNIYFESNPFINNENLVEFNKMMKKIPAPMRRLWQQYMVNRDKLPSQFLTEDNCIDKPFKASAYKSHILGARTSIIFISILTFVFGCGLLVNLAETNLALIMLQSLITSLLVYLLGELYLYFLKSRRNTAIADLYFNFSSLQKYLDRAVTTLPDYIDYEILFTRKEIVNGIPVLQEYLQQRALYEQEQIKKAKESQVEHENYDFSALGVNGSLIMERAMRECEYYLGNRKRVLAEMSELSSTKDLLEKNYEEKNKTNQRKLRDIKESLDRLKDKLDNTTNMIVANDLRKQRENEIVKQRQLEKEVDEDNNKFDEEKKKIDAQLEAKRAEIEEYRQTVEKSLNSEFKVYADKIYTEIRNIADEQVKEEIEELRDNNLKLQQEVEDRERYIVEKNTIYDEKVALLENYANKIAEQEQLIGEVGEANSSISEKDNEIFEIKKELESRNIELERTRKDLEKQKEIIKDIKRKKKIEIYRYFDAYGNEFYVDEDERPYYLNENGERLYTDGGEGDGEKTLVENQPVEEVEKSSVSQLVESELGLSDEDLANAEKTEAEAKNGPVEIENNLGDIFEESTSSQSVESELGFSDEDLVVGKKTPAEAVAENEDLKPVSVEVPNNHELDRADLNEQLEKFAKENEEEKQPEEVKPAEPEYHKPVYDFVWENSNAPEEPVEEIKEEPVIKEEQKSIEDIEKEIEQKNAELEQKHKDLSSQLEETKALAEQKTKEPEKKPATKKKLAKTSSKASSKKASKTAPKKSAAKKPEAKKLETKKAPAKKEAKKVAPKKSEQKNKTVPKKAEVKKSAPKTKKSNNDGNDAATLKITDLSLDQFNEQLKTVMKEINDDNSNK